MKKLGEKSKQRETDLQNDDQDEESEKSRTDQGETGSSKKKGKKPTVRYSLMVRTADTFRSYAKMENRRKVKYFKCRRKNVTARKYRRHRRLSRKVEKKSDELHNAEIEMATIAGLREMYFGRPEILKDVDEIKTGKEPKAQKYPGEKPGVFKRYLDKYNQRYLDELFVKMPREGSIHLEKKEKHGKMKKSRDAIRNGCVVSIFNIDDDNLFTNDELFRIHKMKNNVNLIKERTDQYEDINSKSVWEWDELVNNFSNIPAVKEVPLSESAGEPDTEPIAKPEPEQRMRDYLVNWFQRDSPASEDEVAANKFQFYENRYPRKYEFSTDKSRLNAAVKFLKYAKIVYPGLNCMKVLTDLVRYIGPVTLDDLQAQVKTVESELLRPKKRLRYFRKLLNQTKELENIFVDPKIKTEVKGNLKCDRVTTETLKKQEENLKSTLENIHLSYIYDEYVKSCLPTPFNEIFISVAIGLMKYIVAITSDSQAKKYKNEMTQLVARILELVLESMKWIIDTIFRISAPFDFSEDREAEMEIEPNETEESRPHEGSKEGVDNAVKKLMVHLIKFLNLDYVFHKRDPDISSAECQSVSSISMEGKKKTGRKNRNS